MFAVIPRRPRLLVSHESSRPAICSPAELHPGSICERRGPHAGFKRWFTEFDACLFMAAAVGPGSRRVAATQFRSETGGSKHLRATCGTNRESSTEAGKQFRPVPDQYGNRISITGAVSAPWSSLKILVSTQKMSETVQKCKTTHN